MDALKNGQILTDEEFRIWKDTIGGKSAVVSPDHYERWKIEPITFIMENELPFAVGNVIKYVMRAPYKNGVEDLEKAKRYIDFLINQAEGRSPVSGE